MKELELINEIRKRSGRAKGALKLGIGDDCAVLDFGGRRLLWASDMIAEGTHFTRKDPLEKIGHKAVAVNVSDIAAMGGIPKYITVSLGVPKWITPSGVRNLYDGIFRACRKYGLQLAGGDTILSRELVLDVSIIGEAGEGKVILRSGAKEGDLILITGPVRSGRKEHLDFTPRTGESEFLSKNYKVSSMIDTSDGIAMDIGRICSQSVTGCRLYENAIPLVKGLSLGDALYYGESFELLFTMNKKETKKLFSDKRLKRKCPFYIIGEITGKKAGMTILGEGKIKKLKAYGFRHI